MTESERFEAEALPWIDAIYRAAMAACGRAEQADDLLQETYAKAWERFSQFAPGSNCRAWLMRILVNTRVDWLRKRRPASADPEALDRLAGPQSRLAEDEGEGPARVRAGSPDGARAAQAAQLEQFEDGRLVAALLALPEEFRLALFLVDVEGFTHAEAADVLGVAAGTVKSRTSRARAAVRARLEEESRTTETRSTRRRTGPGLKDLQR